MAMTKCTECGNEISTKADACPKCGAKQVRTSGCARIVLILFGLFVLLLIIGQCSPATTDGTSSSSAHPTTAVSIAAEDDVESKPASASEIGSQWTYTRDADPMADGATYHAMVASTNTVSFDFPYAGAQHGMLALRTHPRYGKDVLFRIERGQILCRSYEDCTILVRFDDGKAQSYSAIGTEDNSTETIFIRNYSRFVGEMMKAKTVRIAVPVYQEGEPAFEFDVRGFDQSKYLAKE
jgi:hypothetical protein